MSKIGTIVAVFILLIILVSLIFFALGYFKPQGAAISVESTPESVVYIDGEMVGRTPYQTNLKPGEIALRIVPQGDSDSFLDYETRINLTPGTKTIVRRIFGGSESGSSGETISFEKNSNGEASLSIISDPDAAQITIDGTVRGFTPIKITRITPGEHRLIVSAPNFASKSFSISAAPGYKLTVISKLAEGVKATPVPLVLAGSEKIIEEVLILDTPIGYLKVRRDPNSLSPEIGRVTPGLKYELVNTDKNTGWYQIVFEKAKSGEAEKVGWISNRYAAIQNPKNESNPE